MGAELKERVFKVYTVSGQLESARCREESDGMEDVLPCGVPPFSPPVSATFWAFCQDFLVGLTVQGVADWSLRFHV